MRKIREVLRLRLGQRLSQRAIGRSLQLSLGAVNTYLSRARMAGLGWPLPTELDDDRLERLLYPPPSDVATERRPLPDWAMVHRELRRPNVTLALLWEEYRTGPGAQAGFGYSWYCDLYREWAGRLKPTLRQLHTAGERVFVDFAGHTMEVIDGATGEVRRAEVFVAVLGASSYTYAEAVWSQSLPDWIAVHVGMLSFLGGAPRQIVSDNLRAGITRACFYEPLVNRTYADMASHYDTAIIPTRPYKPRDKAKVEVGVQVVQRWILARLRNRRFFSLAELNQAIRELIEQLNDRTLRGWDTTRRTLFEQLDRPALQPLPPVAYEYAAWKRCRVNLDYHVEIDKHFYSVPFRLLREEVEARVTTNAVEIFHRGKLVAAHRRSLRPHRPTTVAEHMPSSHRRYLDWTHERIQREAAATARDNKRLGRRLSQARLRQNAVVEDTDFRAQRGLDRALFHTLAGGDWIRHSQHLVISGPTGVGKSWLACALGHKACRDGFSVLYRRAPRLFSELAVARGEGRLPRMLATLERTRLLIIDDWGPEPLTAEQRRDLLEIVDDRYEKGSLLVTSQIPVKRWHELMGDPTIGDAILDRVVHRAQPRRRLGHRPWNGAYTGR